MAVLKAAEDKTFEALEPDNYECVISNLTEIPNTFYDPENDSRNKATQFQWDLTVRQPGSEGAKLRTWTSAVVSTHPRSKLTPLLKMINPSFDPKVGFEDMEQLKDMVIGAGIRVNVQNIEKVKEGETRVYNKVVGFLPSKMTALSATDLKSIREAAKAADLVSELGATEMPF